MNISLSSGATSKSSRILSKERLYFFERVNANWKVFSVFVCSAALIIASWYISLPYYISQSRSICFIILSRKQNGNLMSNLFYSVTMRLYVISSLNVYVLFNCRYLPTSPQNTIYGPYCLWCDNSCFIKSHYFISRH